MASAVPYTPRPFAGDRYEPRGRLGEYMRQRGADTADAIRRSGATSAQMWSGLGQQVGGTLREIATMPAEARQRQMEELRLQREEAAFRDAEQAKQLEVAKVQGVQELFKKYNGELPPESELIDVAGLQDALAIQQAWQSTRPKAAEPFTLNPGDVRFDGQGKQIASVPKPEPVEPPVNLQRETLLVNGRPAVVNFNPRTGVYTDLQGQPVQVAPVPPSRDSDRPMAVAPGSSLVDPATGRVIFSAPDRPKEPPKMAAGTADKVAMAQTSLAALDRLESIVNPVGEDGAAKFRDELMGPWAGRYNAMERSAPGAIGSLLPDAPQGFEDFAAETATLKNQVIQAITGAAVGVQEQGRIMAQIPDVNDTPANWRAKAKATRRNLQELMTNQVRMGTGAREPLQPGATVTINPQAPSNPFRKKP